jgi:hypothetical protein
MFLLPKKTYIKRKYYFILCMRFFFLKYKFIYIFDLKDNKQLLIDNCLDFLYCNSSYILSLFKKKNFFKFLKGNFYILYFNSYKDILNIKLDVFNYALIFKGYFINVNYLYLVNNYYNFYNNNFIIIIKLIERFYCIYKLVIINLYYKIFIILKLITNKKII